MDNSEKIIGEELYLDGKVIKAKRYKVRLSDGSESFREEVEHNGGAAVLAVKDDKFLLVSQFRLAYRKEMLEIPAGKIDAGEDPCVAAKRELEEESGLTALNLKKITALAPSPGYTNELIHIYYTDEFVEGEKHLDEGEFLSAVWLSEDECLKKIESGEINDAKTVVAITAYCLIKSKKSV